MSVNRDKLRKFKFMITKATSIINGIINYALWLLFSG